MKQAHKNVGVWITNEIELNPLESRKSIDVEMREPWAMKQEHKNVAYKRNRTELSLISKINKGRDARAMSNEAST